MRYINIAGIPLGLSRVAMGTTYFGTSLSKKTSFALLDAFATRNGTTIDTARVYGQSAPGGIGPAEQVIGEWLKETGMRQHMVVVTKGLHPDLALKSRYSEKNLWQDLEQSRQSLGCETIDLYLLHRDDPSMPVDEIMEMIAPLVEKGAVRALGASNWNTVRLAQANEYARSHNLPCFMASELQWSLAVSTPASWNDLSLVCMDDDSLAWYQQQSLPVLAYSAQAKGLFSKAISQGMDHLNAKIRNRFINETNIRRIEKVALLAEQRNLSPAAIVMGYLTSHSHPTVAIVGCSTVEQLEDSMVGGNTTISAREREFLLSDK